MPEREISDFNRAIEKISRILNISRASVVRIVHRYEELGTVERRPRSGRPRVSNEREDRYLVQYTRRNRNSTATALRHHFQGMFRRRISTSRIRRRLHSANLRARRSFRVPTILARHRPTRFRWAHEHRDWLLRQWRWVLFSDETRIGLVSDDRRQRV